MKKILFFTVLSLVLNISCNKEKGKVESKCPTKFNADFFINNGHSLLSITKSLDNNFWLGTESGILYKIDEFGTILYRDTIQKDKPIYEILEDSTQLLAGTRNGGIKRYKKENNTLFPTKEKFFIKGKNGTDYSCYSILNTPQYFYFGTSNGLYRFSKADFSKDTIIHLECVVDDRLHDPFKIRQVVANKYDSNSLYLLTENGFYKYHTSDSKIGLLLANNSKFYSSSFINDSIAILCSAVGMFRFNIKTEKGEPFNAPSQILKSTAYYHQSIDRNIWYIGFAEGQTTDSILISNSIQSAKYEYTSAKHYNFVRRIVQDSNYTYMLSGNRILKLPLYYNYYGSCSRAKAICKKNETEIYILAGGQHLYSLKRDSLENSFSELTFLDGIKGENIKDICYFNGYVWLMGTKKVYRYSEKTKKTSEVWSSSRELQHICCADSFLFVNAKTYLFKWTGNKFDSIPKGNFTPNNFDNISSITYNKTNGKLYLGILNNGLFENTDAKFNHFTKIIDYAKTDISDIKVLTDTSKKILLTQDALFFYRNRQVSRYDYPNLKKIFLLNDSTFYALGNDILLPFKIVNDSILCSRGLFHGVNFEQNACLQMDSILLLGSSNGLLVYNPHNPNRPQWINFDKKESFLLKWIVGIGVGVMGIFLIIIMSILKERGRKILKKELEEKRKLEQKLKEEKDKLEEEWREKEKSEKDRIEKEKIEREKLEKEKDRLEEVLRKKEKLEEDRTEKEKIEREKLEKERDRLEEVLRKKEKSEEDRTEKEKIEREKLEKEKDRLEEVLREKEKSEKDRTEKEKIEREKLEKDKLQLERKLQEKDKLENDRAEEEKTKREKLEKDKDKLEEELKRLREGLQEAEEVAVKIRNIESAAENLLGKFSEMPKKRKNPSIYYPTELLINETDKESYAKMAKTLNIDLANLWSGVFRSEIYNLDNMTQFINYLNYNNEKINIFMLLIVKNYTPLQLTILLNLGYLYHQNTTSDIKRRIRDHIRKIKPKGSNLENSFALSTIFNAETFRKKNKKKKNKKEVEENNKKGRNSKRKE